MESSEIQPAKMMGCDPRLPESRPGAGRIPSAAGAASIPGSLAVAGAIFGRSEDQVLQRGSLRDFVHLFPAAGGAVAPLAGAPS